MISVKQLSKEYGGKEILKDITFDIGAQDKIAIVGPNGVGKSTFLKIIAGVLEADEGQVTFPPESVIGYLPQDLIVPPEKTVMEFLKDYCDLTVLEERIAQYEGKEVSDEKELEAYTVLIEAYSHKEGYSFEHRALVMFDGFGLSKETAERSVAELSVGQKAKVFLIAILLKAPDVILLDEPTNNLDLPSIIWLEQFLQQKDVPMLIVSHDTRFLDAIINKVAYLDPELHEIEINRGTYGSYLERRQKRLYRQKEEYEEFVKERDRLRDQARQLRIRSQQGSNFMGTDNDKFARGFKRDQAGRSGKQAKNLEKQLEQMGEVEKPLQKKDYKISITPVAKGGDIRIEHALLGYQNFTLGPVDLLIKFGDKIGFVGPNGVGKSTLLKGFTDSGVLKEGHIYKDARLRIGNFMQQHENLPLDETLIGFLKAELHLPENELYSLIVKHGFRTDQGGKQIRYLSPGEKARTLFAYFSGLDVNVLLLDEPTNHLDIDATEALLAMLGSYEGTVMMISHDRNLLEKGVVQSLYLIDDGKVKYLDNYEMYIESAYKKAKKLLLSY